MHRALRGAAHACAALLATSLVAFAICCASTAAAQPLRFAIPAGELRQALDRFSEQSGLQLVYEHLPATQSDAQAVAGVMTPQSALAQLLRGTDLTWHFINDTMVVVRLRAPEAHVPAPRAVATPVPADLTPLETFVTEGRHDRAGVIPTDEVDSVFGFARSLLDTPRAVTSVGDELMHAYGIESALDVAKLVPGTYTASIFGINGNVNIRGTTSDTYFRGVKRLENTQLFPSPITAMSRIDVVRGPPSPLYGPGKMGGYTNFVPKSARASTGKYVEDMTGKAVVITGSYDKLAGSFELGGAFSIADRRGGMFVYMSAEDSDTYYDHVPFEQYIAQASFDFEFSDRVRTEFGHMFQHWGGTELAGWNRLTQQLVDDGSYQAGTMRVNMDAISDGLISTAEVDAYGPLLRTFDLSTPGNVVAAELAANWRIDPATARLVPLSRHATAQSPEDDGAADVHLAYVDVIWELSANATLTNKMYFETMDRYKWTRASAFGQDTRSSVFEEKVLYEYGWRGDSEARVDVAGSMLFRHYDTRNLTGSKYSDLVNRPDISQPFSAIDRFAVPNLEPELAPWNTGLTSRYDTLGVGLLTEVSYKRASVVLGARYDHVDIDSRIPDFVLTTPGLAAQATDAGTSYSLSLSYAVREGVRPYLTYARQETLVYGIDGGIPIAVVPNAMNASELHEAGLKMASVDGTLYATIAAYRQRRVAYFAETTQVPSTHSSGWEYELRWAPTRRLSLSAGGNSQSTHYVPARSATVHVSPASFGLEGDYFGGRLQAVLPSNRYQERAGYPQRSLNVSGTYFFMPAVALHVSATYQDEIRSGRLDRVTLPAARWTGAALSYETARLGARVTVNNLLNELYFIPNSPDVTGEVIAIPAPERNYQLSLAVKF
jgi:iron complex outermembrane recepter protein